MSALSYHTKQCKALARWARMQWNVVPQLRALIYIPMDGKRSPAAGAILKAQGMRAGVWDYLLGAPSGVQPRGFETRMRHGLWIEIKSEDDELSPEQKLWGEIERGLGYATVVCRTWVGARDNLLDYLAVKHTPSTTKGKEWRT